MPSAAALGSSLCGHFLPGYDSFWTYVNLLYGASILHHAGGLHKIGDSLAPFAPVPVESPASSETGHCLCFAQALPGMGRPRPGIPRRRSHRPARQPSFAPERHAFFAVSGSLLPFFCPSAATPLRTPSLLSRNPAPFSPVPFVPERERRNAQPSEVCMAAGICSRKLSQNPFVQNLRALYVALTLQIMPIAFASLSFKSFSCCSKPLLLYSVSRSLI